MRLLLLLLIPCLVIAAPKPKPTPIVKQDMVCRTKQQDAELRDWITGLMAQVHLAQSDAKAANDSNAATQAQLKASVDAATALANECAADKACAKAPLSCWFHRLLKHILWIGAALIVILIAVTIFAPGATKLIISVFTFIWNWIVALFTPKPPPKP